MPTFNRIYIYCCQLKQAPEPQPVPEQHQLTLSLDSISTGPVTVPPSASQAPFTPTPPLAGPRGVDAIDTDALYFASSTVLTRQSLRTWTKATNITASERAQRVWAEKKIIAAACKPRSGELRIVGNLDLYGNKLSFVPFSKLTNLPAGLRVGGCFDLGGSSLTHLPAGFSVGCCLDLRGCTSLTHLPANFSVGAWLDLSGCRALAYLPAGLKVGGWLNLEGCTSLTHMPADLSVGRDLYLRHCTAFTHLPLDVLSWPCGADGKHNIYLEDTGITLSTRRQLEDWAARQDSDRIGVQLHFGKARAAGLTQFADLQTA